MIRLEDFRHDPEIEQALLGAAAIHTALEHMRDQIFVLQATLDQVDNQGADLPAVAAGLHKYVRLDLRNFFPGLFMLETFLKADPDFQHPTHPHRPARFVDAGCGTGRIVALLRATDRFGFHEVCGFDLSEQLIARGRARYGLSERDLFVADAMEHDYGGHDVVYFFRPFEDEALQRAFENRVVATMPTGAYLLAFAQLGLDDDIRLERKDYVSGIYKKL